MKALVVVVVLLLSTQQQAPTIKQYRATNRSDIISVQPSDGRLILSANKGEAALTGSQLGNAVANPQLAISIWNDLNAMCRGGAGNRPETEYACCVRSKVDVLLNNMGYCYQMGDTWRKCRPRDKRARNVGLTDCVR